MDTAAARTFAGRLYTKLAGQFAGENLFCSPFSVRAALAMCAAGARGETRCVLAGLIGEPESVGEPNRQFARLPAHGDDPFGLVTANALWGQEGYRFRPEFTRAAAEVHDGTVRAVNFRDRPDEAAAAINAWVAERTRDRITGLVSRGGLAADTRLVLTTAVYFRGEWEDVFRESQTGDEGWHGPHGTRAVPMMHRAGGYSYYEGGGVRALELPYKGGRAAMLVVLPGEAESLAALEARWFAGGLDRRAAAGLRFEERVAVSLPRFTVATELDLTAALCGLGAGLAFGGGADFGGIGDEPLALSAVAHTAFVAVAEGGTEAAGATAVRLALKGIRVGPDPKVFRADRPFLFLIRDRVTGAVWFCGRVLDPN